MLGLLCSCPLFAADGFHLFAETSSPGPPLATPGLVGLPPARPLESMGSSPRAPSGTEPASGVRSLPPFPTERRFGLAAAEWIGTNVVPWAFNRYVLHGEYANLSVDAIRHNHQTGFAYDRDFFTTNQMAHPIHGGLYFNAARSNGFSFWESAPFTFLGSYMWEMYFENEPAAMNDLVNTTLGGMAHGEIQHRVANMILDNTVSGFDRLLREVGSLVLNPMGGIDRLIKGQMWNDSQNPLDRFPSRFYLELDGMYGHRIGSNAGDADKVQGGLSLLIRYGDPFDGDHREPFEYFDLGADLVQPASSLVTRFESRGLLRGFRLGDGRPLDQRLGFFLHFEFFNNDPSIYGSQGFSFDHLTRVPLADQTELRTDIALLGIPMAALHTDYSEIAAVDFGRRYDYGSGGGPQATVQIRRRDMDLLSLSYQVFWLSTLNGVSRNNRVQSFAAEGRVPVGKRFIAGAGWTWGERLSTYDSLPTVNVSGTTWRAFVGWHGRDRWDTAQPAAAPSAPASADSTGRWEVTAFGGGFFGSRVFTSPELHVMTATAPAYGARVGYGLTRVFGLEAGWSRASSKLVPQTPETSEPVGPTSPLTVNTYELNGLFGFGSGPARGYVGLGGGLMSLAPNVPTLDRSGGTTAFAANVALGGKYFLFDAFAIRVDGRYRWRAADVRLGTAVCDYEGCEPYTTNLYSSVELTGGLTVRF